MNRVISSKAITSLSRPRSSRAALVEPCRYTADVDHALPHASQVATPALTGPRGRRSAESAVSTGVGETALVVVGQSEQRFGAVAVVRRAVHDRQRFGLELGEPAD